MRSSAQINKIALAIECHGLASRYCLNKLNFERLIIFPVESHRLITGPDLAGNRLVTINYFVHPGLNGFEVRIREWYFAMEIIIEPVFNGRTNRHLGFRIDFKDSLRHHMRTIMTQQRERTVILGCYQCQRCVSLDWA